MPSKKRANRYRTFSSRPYEYSRDNVSTGYDTFQPSCSAIKTNFQEPDYPIKANISEEFSPSGCYVRSSNKNRTSQRSVKYSRNKVSPVSSLPTTVPRIPEISLCENSTLPPFSRLQFSESRRNLFSVPLDFSLAHCVSADMHMSKGIARSFKKKFQSQDFLLSQQQGPGGVAFLSDSSRYIYYLVTKKHFSDKPTYDGLYLSLLHLKTVVLTHGVTKLTIPALGCGLDGLEWPRVRSIILSCFADTDLEILVCHYVPPKR
ncbi:hypothetical protein NQ314_005087 [Rhamnusium bicolor]|uniref:Macro domain-containing protein n=1 Tax=Rhamnusium bicolor TaxID=1586634 RepID=A0AAV8ZHF0_9CUCU|nr:hypothetical protein NQ314_005087 [Rhamnusium bicolor]